MEIDKERIDKRSKAPNIISCGITHVDGRLIFKLGKKWRNVYYSICHFSEHIFAISPIDYQYPTMVTTIYVSPVDGFCEKANSCLHFKCFLNKFNKDAFIREFKGCGVFSLGLPLSLGTKSLWFNDENEKWSRVWKDFIILRDGGILKFNEGKGE